MKTGRRATLTTTARLAGNDQIDQPALGFHHVADGRAVMNTNWPTATFTDREQFYAQLAYEAGRGMPYQGWPFGGLSNGPRPPLPPMFVVD